MKCVTTFLLVLAALAVSTTSLAQSQDNTYKHWAAVTWSGYPVTAGENFSETGNYRYYDLSYNNGEVRHIYKDYRGPVYSIGNITAEYGWSVTRWFSWDITLGFCPLWKTYYDAILEQKSWTAFGCTTYVMPEVALTWIKKPKFHMTTSFGLGLGFNIGNGYSSAAIPMVQFDIIGLEFGKKFYGTAKLGVGTEFMGLKLGAGYRF